MDEIKISKLIDRVRLIAKQNKDEKLLKWAHLESFGYNYSNKYMTDKDEVPEYREIPIEHRDQYDNPIIFTNSNAKDFNNTKIRHSVLELEEFSMSNDLLTVKDPLVINIINKYFNVPASYYIFDPNSLKSVLHSIQIEAFDRVEKYINSEDIMDESLKLFPQKKRTGVISKVISNSIFVSYSFNSRDKELVNGLIELLKSAGFKVITGEKNPIGSISKSIINKINKAEKFVVIMTKRDKKENGKFTTSSWLLEEKGIAIAYDKPCIIFVENEVDNNEIGGVQGDDQRIPFTRNNFSAKVDLAIKMLKGEVD